MIKTAIVTGAEGFIGSHMAKFLQGRGWSVVGTYGSESSAPFSKAAKLTVRTMRSPEWAARNTSFGPVSTYAHLSLRSTELAHGVMGGSS